MLSIFITGFVKIAVTSFVVIFVQGASLYGGQESVETTTTTTSTSILFNDITLVSESSERATAGKITTMRVVDLNSSDAMMNANEDHQNEVGI